MHWQNEVNLICPLLRQEKHSNVKAYYRFSNKTHIASSSSNSPYSCIVLNSVRVRAAIYQTVSRTTPCFQAIDCDVFQVHRIRAKCGERAMFTI